MHVAVDAHNLLHDRRGIGVYLRALLPRIAKSCRITLVVRHPFPALLKRALAEESGLTEFSAATRVPNDADVAWHPWNGTFFTGARRNVATVHDVAPFAFPAHDERLRRSQQEPFERSARTADAIIADSSFTKTELEKHLSVRADRIAVIPLAAASHFSPGEPAELPQSLRGSRYILYVGTLEERKNAPTLFAAWERALEPEGIALAVVTSDRAPERAVHFRNPSPEQLRGLYRGALCFAFPSVYEGFGLPPLESMACGTPVLVSRAASLPEVCGDAARYVDDPLSVDAWASALVEIVLGDAVRADLSARGLARAANFSWEDTARKTLAVLADAA